ncbi:hypothetical protein DB346_11760 [Verrucomicrobia bacterium LW23]|nr:hypothetical protein DB346_11760 [Verrucomicrobia bacterium LW23]
MALLDFEQYVEHATASDELRRENAFVARAYRQMERVVQALGQSGVDRLSRIAYGQMRDQGITYHVYHDERGPERIFPLDIIPLPIAGDEWAEIEQGLAQRTKVWNMFLRDIYGPQEILKAGIVPFELIYSDPHFHRECVGLQVPRDTYVHVAAYDMVRHPGGRWMVMEDHLSNPTGASYALQARRVMSQVCPQMMEGISVAPIYNYPTQLLETLQAAAPNYAAGSRVVLLSPGIYNEAYYDHSSLARQMGIPLVQGNDLIVLESKLYLKTIGGLERVDVIYRRLDSEYIDPVTFRADSRLGIPGLLSCLRKGTVTVANALGTGLADNRAISDYVPAMTEFYFNEKPRMKSVPILNMNDVDEREQVLDNWSNYTIKHAIGRGPGSFWIGSDLQEAEWLKLRKKIEANPRSYIAQPVVQFSTAPTWIDSELQPRHIGVRAFTLCGNNIHTTPCALTRVALEDESLVISSASGGGSKDTWILRTPTHRMIPPEVNIRHTPRRMRLASRTADSLFWMGRYMERAEGTTRIMRVVEQIRNEASSGDSPRAWAPLLEALASATGQPTSIIRRAAALPREGRAGKSKQRGLAAYMLLSEDNYSSVLSCMRSCRGNAQAIREALPPEVWTIINRIYLQLAQQSRNMSGERVKAQLRDLSLEDDILSQLDELTGCADKHMLHNDAWSFWQMGRHSERALFTLLTMRQVYLKRSVDQTAAARNGTGAGDIDFDDTNLDALLRMLAGLYAYRSSYKSRPTASQVAHLLLQDQEFPRSVWFCMDEVMRLLRRAFGQRPSPEAEEPIHYGDHLLSELNFTDIGQFFVASRPGAGPGGGNALSLPAATTGVPPTPVDHIAAAGLGSFGLNPNSSPRARAKAFTDWLSSLNQRTLALNTLVSDHYLNHQAAAPLPRES